MCNKEHYCQECGDKLIHQFKRGEHESSSALGQFIHEQVTGKTSVVDADHQLVSAGVDECEALDSQIHQLHFSSDLPRLKVIEHKPPGKGLSRAQRWVMPIWRDLIQIGIRTGVLSRRSGVFLVEAQPPFERFELTHFGEFGKAETRDWSRDEFINWMGGKR